MTGLEQEKRPTRPVGRRQLHRAPPQIEGTRVKGKHSAIAGDRRGGRVLSYYRGRRVEADERPL